MLLFLTFSVLAANPKKTLLHGSLSRSLSVEQGKYNKRESMAAHRLPANRGIIFHEIISSVFQFRLANSTLTLSLTLTQTPLPLLTARSHFMACAWS